MTAAIVKKSAMSDPALSDPRLVKGP